MFSVFKYILASFFFLEEIIQTLMQELGAFPEYIVEVCDIVLFSS